MNKEEAKKARYLLQAYIDGKKIQIDSHGTWHTTDNPGFNFADCKYRVKPKEPELQRSEIVGRKVKDKVTGDCNLIVSSTTHEGDTRYFFAPSAHCLTYEEILEAYEFVE
jgi:hypothetical protein